MQDLRIRYRRMIRRKEDFHYEDDISAQEETAFQGARIQKENEHCKRKKGFGRKTCEGKKELISVGHRLCDLFFFNLSGESYATHSNT